jgi:hypothetical protein
MAPKQARQPIKGLFRICEVDGDLPKVISVI